MGSDVNFGVGSWEGRGMDLRMGSDHEEPSGSSLGRSFTSNFIQRVWCKG